MAFAHASPAPSTSSLPPMLSGEVLLTLKPSLNTKPGQASSGQSHPSSAHLVVTLAEWVGPYWTKLREGTDWVDLVSAVSPTLPSTRPGTESMLRKYQPNEAMDGWMDR